MGHTALSQDNKTNRAISKIAEWLALFADPLAAIEIRALHCSFPRYQRPHTRAGFFDCLHLLDAATAAFDLTQTAGRTKGVYFTLNPVSPDLLARRNNRIDVADPDLLTHDANILRRRWLLIDVDPIRIAGVSSTDAEKAAAAEVIALIRDFLFMAGWPDPIVADSGNGWHLLFRLDSPVDDGGVLQRCLQALAAKFNTPAATIDTSVFNPSRICKLYGTVSRKGDHTEERPHRRSRITEIPEKIETVSPELLAALAALAPQPAAALPASTNGHASGTNGTPRKRGGRGLGKKTILQRAAAYLEKVDPAIAGQGGHDQTYHAAAILVTGFALSPTEALPLLTDWNVRCSPPWPEADLLRKLQEAESAPGERGKLIGPSDHRSPSGRGPNLTVSQDGAPPEEICNAFKSDDKIIPVPIQTIIETALRITGDWPRRIDDQLFYHDPETDKVQWLRKTSALFGFFGSVADNPPRFSATDGLHTKEEVFAELQRTATAYDAIETVPHEPPIPNHYYATPIPGPGDGSALSGLVSRFNPETPVDGDLIVAMLATLVWGGPGGTRPAFVVTSDDGRGVGKTKMATLVASIVGGHIELSANEDISLIKARLLSKEGRCKRVALLDNLKSLRFSWAELEALITSETISGKQMYVGEAIRPNILTTLITLNGVSLSTDMAQRSVIIKILRPIHSGGWEDEVKNYIRTRREAIIGDLIAFLRQPRAELRRYSRWGTWEQEILSRLPDPAEAQQVIVERQVGSDVEENEAKNLEDYFGRMLEELTYDIDVDRVWIPNETFVNWFNKAYNLSHSLTAAKQLLKQMILESKIERISISEDHSDGRGVNWIGKNTDFSVPLRRDIKTRIEAEEARKKSDRRGF